GLSAADIARLAALPLRTICDLRGTRECAAMPSPAIPGAVNLAMTIEPRIGASLRDLLRRQEATGEDVVAILREAYIAYVTAFLPVYHRLFDLILEESRLPLVFHCTAGKDRTGVGAALLLTALGVDDEHIIADYRATDRFWDRNHALPEGTSQAVADAFLGTHTPVMQAALAAAEAPFGSRAALLEQGLGLDSRRLAALRAKLLD
ncbi:MAG TPA: tyrosine-protein phosphatase, partial [Acetobacteraceae bacterium]|nr:tyrosine-protein phosphatase [Acetobacteraceae bacterium]